MKSGLVSFVGRPNAGKSTLLNRLVGSKLAIVSDKPQTTRTRILGVRNYPDAQLVLVDTPGIREFGLWGMDPRELRHAYREMAALAPACRFADCLHEREPGCAVKDAAAAGAIAPCRFESYLRLLRGLREAREQQ